MNAGVPRAHGPSGEVRQTQDTGPLLRDEHDIDLLKDCADCGQGQAAIPCRKNALQASCLSEVLASVSDQPLRIGVGATGRNIDPEPFLAVESPILGQVVSGELRLMKPFELQRYPDFACSPHKIP